jgi:hypothetical protein
MIKDYKRRHKPDDASLRIEGCGGCGCELALRLRCEFGSNQGTIRDISTPLSARVLVK